MDTISGSRVKECIGLVVVLGAASMRLAAGQPANDDSDARPPVAQADLQIVARARQILDSPSKWNRADTRICPPSATTFSLYCALETATIEVTRGFEHRGSAMQEARFAIEDVSPKGKQYDHRLMGYNNDPSTTFADIQKVFGLLEARIANRLKGQAGGSDFAARTPPAKSTSPVTGVDLEVLKQARTLLDLESKWNRADNQDCPSGASTVSLFGAFYRAAMDIAGRFSNQGAAIREARSVISESAPNRAKYQSRLTDFNNDPSTTWRYPEAISDGSGSPREASLPSPREVSELASGAPSLFANPCTRIIRGAQNMFITKKHLTRRTVLRGIGTAVALPLLDAMIPAGVALADTAAKATPHVGFIYFPHGAVQAQWTPTGEGQIGEFRDILKPLEKYKSMTTVFSNIDNQAAVGPVHALSPGTWLSCVHPAMSQEAHGGTTADQIAAAQIGQDTPLPSLEVATENHGGGGFCDRDYGCSYSGTISFRTPTTPLPMEIDPRKLFIRLFGQGDNAAERARLTKQYASLLDMVGQETKQLQSVVGPSDKAMLSDYLESVREIERRIQKMEARDLSHVTIPDAPKETALAFDERINLMFDLVALAYQANFTRVFTFMVAAEVSGQTYNHIGVPDAFHPLSHHNNEQSKMERLTKVQAYHTSVFAKFLDKLAKMPDGDGTMLDHSLFLYGSNMANSNAHNHYPIPTSLVGGWKTVKGGQHIVPPEHTPLANVLLTMLDRVGISQDKIGNSTGKLVEV